jgi:uncharacterized protein (DUF2235 family)
MRRLVLLCDGTWSKPESDTNVERLRRLIATRDATGIEQRINYLPGVGVKPGIGHWLGGAFGYGFADTVKQGYRWLCDSWQAGDELYLIGYSRGAYAARSLGGMIRKCGLLRRRGPDAVSRREVAAAYAFYRETTIKPSDPVAVAFRAEHSEETDIHFMGVWETVGLLGIPDVAAWFPFASARYRFHDTELSRIVKCAYQALALDEHRADFAPALWTRNPATVPPGETCTMKKREQIEIEQRWFIGAHADVGGGYAHDGAGHVPDPLPELALAWLQRKAMGCGLAFTAPFMPALDAWTGVPRNSYAEFLFGLYRLFSRPMNRVVGGAINETVDDSVWVRWLADPTYRPPSLAQALDASLTAPGSSPS